MSESGRTTAFDARDPAHGAEPVGPASEKASLGDFFAVIARRWLTVAVVTAAALAVAIAYILLSPPKYTASTSILLATGSRSLLRPDTGMPTEVPDATLIESQLKVIASETVLGRVVDEQHLVDDPEFVPTTPGLREQLLRFLGLASSSGPPPNRRAVAIMALGKAISVRRSERTYVLDLDVTSRDPLTAAHLADATAAAFLDDQKAARESHSDATGDYLKTRVVELQTRLLDAENKVEAYKEANGIQGASGKLINEEQLAALNAELARAKVRTADARAAFEQVQRLLRSGRVPDSTSDALKSPTIERLRSQYAEIVRQEATYRASLGARHPSYIEVQAQLRDTRALITDELRRVSESARNQFLLASSSETQVARQFGEASRASTTTSQALVRLRELQRRVDAAQADYDRALRSRETVRDAGAELPGARIIASANVPVAPSAPKRLAILALALAGGLFFGVGAAAFREQLDRGRAPRSPRVRTVLRRARQAVDDLAVIGVIPRMGILRRQTSWLARFGRAQADTAPSDTFRPLHALSDDPASPFSEAIRKLYGELRRNTHSGRGRVVLITSDDAGAGKSTIAVNLARAACERGERALLIEGNPDDPVLMQLVGSDATPTLIELAGTTRLSFAVEAGTDRSFRLVPILRGEDEEVERQREMGVASISGIKGNFDFVVIDGPTIGADDTASLVAEAVDHVVLVMPQTAQPDMIEDALGRLQVPKWKFRGTVLSKVDVGRIAA